MPLWSEGATTDRAIELLHRCGAKTDADGNVVPRHRYSRSMRHAAYEALWDIDPWGKASVTLRRERRGDLWGVVCEIEGASGEWEQVGEAWSDEELHSRGAMAICRALLNYTTDDGEPMTEHQVVAMLEARRRGGLACARNPRQGTR